MPEKTADDLARILSLASSNAPPPNARSNEAPAPGPAAGPPAAPGPAYPVEPRVPGEPEVEARVQPRELSPGLMNTLFYDFGTPGSPDQASTSNARPRFNSKVEPAPSPLLLKCRAATAAGRFDACGRALPGPRPRPDPVVELLSFWDVNEMLTPQSRQEVTSGGLGVCA